jgi:hypothetical protein
MYGRTPDLFARKIFAWALRNIPNCVNILVDGRIYRKTFSEVRSMLDPFRSILIYV